MKKIAKTILVLVFPLGILVMVGWWILDDDESLPDLLRAYFDNANGL